MTPLTLSWNQVHRMVRDNLLEIDDLKREHDAIYSELLSCYGLEKCLRGFDIDLATSNKVAAGELLAKLQRQREQHRQEQSRYQGGGGGNAFRMESGGAGGG